eukprot:gene3312-13339_t
MSAPAEDQLSKKPRLGDATGSEPKASSLVLSPADEVVNFRMLTSSTADALQAEIDAGGAEFNGEFFHQHFNLEGREEQIRGYIGLNVNIWISAHTLHMWLDIKYEKRKPGADKLEKIFGESGPPGGFLSSRQAFVDTVTCEISSMPDILALGEEVCSMSVAGGQSNVKIMRYNLAKTDAAVKAIHARMEPLMLFFIDGASSIDAEDDMWELLLALKPQPNGGNLLGLQTLYKFWAYPDSNRLRLSQVLVLPPYQGIGIGKKFLQIEDPSPNLQCVREKLESEMMMAQPWISEQVLQCAQAAMSSPGGLKSAVSGNLSKAASNKNPCRPPAGLISRITNELKITKKEVTLAWECVMYCQSGLMESKAGKEALENLVSYRLEGSHFAHNAGDAEAKQLVPLSSGARDFIMFRFAKGKENCEPSTSAPTTGSLAVRNENGGASAMDTEAAAEASPTVVDNMGQAIADALIQAMKPNATASNVASGKSVVASNGHGSCSRSCPNEVYSKGQAIADALIQAMKPNGTASNAAPGESDASGAAEDGQAVASGRLSITSVSATEKAERMSELLEERLAALSTLRSLPMGSEEAGCGSRQRKRPRAGYSYSWCRRAAEHFGYGL